MTPRVSFYQGQNLNGAKDASDGNNLSDAVLVHQLLVVQDFSFGQRVSFSYHLPPNTTLNILKHFKNETRHPPPPTPTGTACKQNLAAASHVTRAVKIGPLQFRPITVSAHKSFQDWHTPELRIVIDDIEN